MSAARWNPPAFLLPSWSESQIALLRRKCPDKPPSIPFASYSTENGSPYSLPRRDAKGRRIMRPSDELGISKSSRVPTLSSIGEEAGSGTRHSTAHAILAVRRNIQRRDAVLRDWRVGRHVTPLQKRSEAMGREVEAATEQEQATSGNEGLAADDDESIKIRTHYTKKMFLDQKEGSGHERSLIRRHAARERRSSALTKLPGSLSFRMVGTADSKGSVSGPSVVKEPALWTELFGTPTSRAQGGRASSQTKTYTSPGYRNHDGQSGDGTTERFGGTSADMPKGLTIQQLRNRWDDNLKKYQHRANRRLRAWLKEDRDKPKPVISWLGPQISGSRKATIDTVILVYETYDQTLEKEDFLRVVPRGQHMQEWQVVGQPMYVVPGRNHKTLERKPFYLLTFENKQQAEAFLKQEDLMRRAMQAHHSGSLKMLPPSVLGLTGQANVDIELLKNEYALATDGQQSNWKRLYNSSDQIKNGVLPRLLDRAADEQLRGSQGRSVVFWLEGYRPSVDDIRTTLAKDEAERGILWSTLDRIHQQLPGRDPINRRAGHGPFELKDVDDGNNSREGPSDREENFDKADANKKDSYADNITKNDAADTEPLEDGVLRWVLSFDDEPEARRFIRTWHMRIWPQASEQRQQGNRGETHAGSQIVAHASLLW